MFDDSPWNFQSRELAFKVSIHCICHHSSTDKIKHEMAKRFGTLHNPQLVPDFWFQSLEYRNNPVCYLVRMNTCSNWVCSLLMKKWIGLTVGSCDNIMSLENICSLLEVIWGVR
jgi:hypothetical protein